MPLMSTLRVKVPTLEEVKRETQRAFGKDPCLFQARDCIAQLSGKDVITISPTGSGKTLTFWMPLLFANNGITIIITALNILGDENVKELERLKIKGVNITGKNASPALFKAIEECKYRVIVVSPELILNDDRFNLLWESKQFTSRLFNISIDEAHCIKQWGKDFRPDYANLGRLRWLVPSHVRFHLVSATLPDFLLKDVMDKMCMREANLEIIRRPNDRPNIHIMVEEMKYSPSSIHDLERILRLHLRVEGNGPACKFMIFANSRKLTEEGAQKMWNELKLPPDLKEKIVWFHSGMSAEFREETLQKLREGTIWGLFCTDAAGMGLDLPDIDLIIQWRYIKSLCVLMQRFGRGGRGQGTEATGIYLVESQYFDHAKDQAKARKRKAQAELKDGKKRKKRKDNTLRTTVNRRVLSEVEESGPKDNDPRECVEVEQEGRDDVEVNEQLEVAESTEPLPTQRMGEPNRHNMHLLPSFVGLNEDEYEEIAMDIFINAPIAFSGTDVEW